MTKAPQTALSHPLVVAYLSELERALASADSQERLDTVTAVTEHLTDALGGEAAPTTEQVRAVLDELGSVERIADAATPALASTASVPPASALATDEKPPGSWIAPALLAAAIVSLVIPFLGALLAIGCLVAAIVLLRGENPRRSVLRATVGVSIVTLVITAVLAYYTLAFASFSATSTTDTGGSVVVTSTNP